MSRDRMRRHGRSRERSRAARWLMPAVASGALASAAAAGARADEVPSTPADLSVFSVEAAVEGWAFGDRVQQRIVGARKREENAQEVPGSITTLPRNTLVR